MAALETTPTAAESERDLISKFRARQCTRNHLAQLVETTPDITRDFVLSESVPWISATTSTRSYTLYTVPRYHPCTQTGAHYQGGASGESR
jgi:hypothetical protein